MTNPLNNNKSEEELRIEFDRRLEIRQLNKIKKADKFFNSLKFSKYGVPQLSQNRIEELSNIFLSIYSPDTLSSPQSTPLMKIVNELILQNKLKLDCNQNLYSSRTEKVLGKTIFDKKLILIDNSIINQHQRFNFVLGHELGHLFLHTRKKIIDDCKKFINFSEDGAKNFLLYPHKTFSVRNKIEWQANAFSAALLMPQKTFSRGLIKIQIDLGIHRNIGIIYLDNSIHNRSAFYKTLENLSRLFNTSLLATKYRLLNLNLVVDVTQPKNSFKSFSEVFNQIR